MNRREFVRRSPALALVPLALPRWDADALGPLLDRTLATRRAHARLQAPYDALNAAHVAAGYGPGPECEAVRAFEQGPLQDASHADWVASEALVDAIAARGVRAAIVGDHLVVDVRQLDRLPHFNDLALVIPLDLVHGHPKGGDR